MSKHYYVTGEYVTVKTATMDGPRIIGMYRGATVPADATDEWIEHHLKVGLIEEGEVDEGFVDEKVAIGPDIPASGSEMAPPPAPDEPGAEPKKTANRDAWVEYAVSKGADRADIEEKKVTKADLIAVYGSGK